MGTIKSLLHWEIYFIWMQIKTIIFQLQAKDSKIMLVYNLENLIFSPPPVMPHKLFSLTRNVQLIFANQLCVLYTDFLKQITRQKGS